MAEIVIFLDVDGTILCAPEKADHESIVHRDFVQAASTQIVNGFEIVKPARTFKIENEIFWRSKVANFFLVNQLNIKVVWLTGWVNNAVKLEEFLPIRSIDALEWEVSMDETGKKEALVDWLNQNTWVDGFIWADDVATVTSGPHTDFSIPNLILTPDVDMALSDDELEQMQAFINQF